MKTESSDNQNIAPAIAEKILAKQAFKGQRNLRKHKVTQYAELMTKGLWDATSIIKFGTLDASNWYLLDGQHRLAAIVESGCLNINFTVQKIFAEKQAQLNEIYFRTDRGMPRSISDTYSVLGIHEELGLKPFYVTKAGAACKVLLTSFGMPGGIKRSLVSDEETIECMRKYALSIKTFYELCKRGDTVTNKALLRRSVLAMAIGTLQHSSEIYGLDKVCEFWRGVSQDDRLSKDDPRKVAIKHLQTTVMSANDKGPGKKPISEAYQLRYMASCFNGFIQDKKMVQARIKSDRAPLVILGTPWMEK